VRHYLKKDEEKEENTNEKEHLKLNRNNKDKDPNGNSVQSKKKSSVATLPAGIGDGRFKEFHIKEHFKTVDDALDIFKDDELLFKPGKFIRLKWIF